MSGAAALAIGGVAPAGVAGARSEEDVVAALGDANERGLGLVVAGGATRLEVGDAPQRYDVALDLTELTGIVEHEPGDLTATVRAGTTLADLHGSLERHGQRWPVEAGLADDATVGGVLAGSAAGPSRLRYGHPRDWTLGVRAVLGDGRATRAGGKVVKNVTGYDLARFYAGSYGTLCVLTEVSLKLWPVPAAERTLVAHFDDPAVAAEALGTLWRDRIQVDAVASLDRAASTLIQRDAALLVAVRMTGAPGTVERTADLVAQALSPGRPEGGPPALWRAVADLPHRAPVVLRLTAPERRIGDLLRDAGEGVLRYPGTGIAFLLREAAEAAWVARLRAAAEAAEGACVVERAPASLRLAVGTWGRCRLPEDLARRIKRALDPRGVLGPGRLPWTGR